MFESKNRYYCNTDHNEGNVLETLLIRKKEITVLKVLIHNVKSNIAKAIFDLLDNKYCNITILNLTFYDISQEDSEYFMNFIKNNKSLENIEIMSFNSIHEIYMDIHDTFLKNIASLIHNHPCIKHLSLEIPNINKSLIDITNHKPKTLKHICIYSKNHLNPDALKHLITYGNMKVINVSGIDLVSDCRIGSDIFQYNTSTIKFIYTPYHYELLGRIDIDDEIENMLKRNNDALNKARNSALTLLTIRRYRYNKCTVLSQLPKDVVKILANYIYDSYVDDEWR